MTTVKVAAAQIRPVLFSLDGSLQKVLDAMAEAAAQGVELIVFPETFLPYYPYFSFVEPPGGLRSFDFYLVFSIFLYMFFICFILFFF